MTAKSLIHIAFDTNIMYATTAEYFLNKKFGALIKQFLDLPTLDVKWYLPSVVRGERHQQILRAVPGLLEKFRKIEILMDTAYGVTDALIGEAIEKRINKQIADHEIVVAELNAKRVYWAELIRRAVCREAPFEKQGENEKGFRDAIILEVMCQLYYTVVKPKRGEQYFVACGDERFREAAKERLEGKLGVKIFSNADGLATSLNALKAKLTLETVQRLVASAHEFFGQAFAAEQIAEAIYTRYSKELKRGPTPSDDVTQQGTSITGTTFLKKEESPVVSG
jgi:hypothetical protein